MIEHTIVLPSIEMHVVERGGGTPLILLHGITANARVWDPVSDALAARCRTIAVDQRGHGRSRTTAGGYEAEDYAGDVHALIEALALEKAVVVGHSLGARNALVAGASGNPAIAAVVAIDYTPFVDTEIFDALDARVGGGDRVFDDREDLRAALAERYPMTPPDAIERRVEHSYAVDAEGRWHPRAEGASMAATCKGLRADLAPAIRDIAVPTLLVRGTESQFVSEAAFARTQALRPDIEAVLVEGSDHYVPEVRPRETIALIEAFLDKHGLAPAA